MICSAEHIKQPLSGQYVEKIYDISSNWNSANWTWIRFEDENDEWCGNFRGEFRGVSISKKLGVVVVLTTDYMFILDINNAKLIEYDFHPDYTDLTTSPDGDVLITDGSGIERLVNGENEKLESVVIPYIPVQTDNLRFVEWNGNTLKITCNEYLKYDNEIELYLDYKTMEWVCNLNSNRSKKSLSFKEKIFGLSTGNK